MIIFRAYLLVGLVGHKALWEVLKHRRGRAGEQGRPSLGMILVGLLKIGILAGIAVQCLIPEILPIGGEAFGRRVIGGVVYTVGLLTAVLGRVHLGDNWSDIEAGQVREDHTVVTHGVYRFL
ncbi:MAG: hypothetical protein IIA41_03365, partial [SAR324 cluster bacterium]|nr:hypothetical protein [SAR324 cluster bacterium]